MTMMSRDLSLKTAVRGTAPKMLNIIKLCPFIWLSFLAHTLLSGVLPAVSVPVNHLLYDALADMVMVPAILTNDEPIFRVVAGIGLVFALMIFGQILTIAGKYITWRKDNIIQPEYSRILNHKMTLLPTKAFEDKDILDDIEKATSGIYAMSAMYHLFADILFRYGVFFIAMGLFLWRIQPVLVLSLIFVFIPVLLSQLVRVRIYAEQQDYIVPLQRKEYQYYKHACDTRDTRLFGVFDHFHKLMLQARLLFFAKQWDTQIKVTIIDLCLNMAQVAGMIGIIVLLIKGIMNGEVSVGAFVAVFNAINTMFSYMTGFFSSIKSAAIDRIGEIHNFVRFMNLPETGGATAPPDWSRGGVGATGLVFIYPKSQIPAVNAVTLTIRQGETIAIVGENGSGKTTLVKLLCGLFKPDSGILTIGGQDTALTDDKSLFAETSAVFQKYVQYNQLSLADNVMISDYHSEENVIPALISAEVDYTDAKTFPKGTQTILSREFEGVQISGGQWQRIAIARGMHRKHEFIILDEPTAAIDPIEETRVYQQFAKFAKNKTAILVTHRLGSARIADRIVVMDNGRIAEIGRHEELLARGGKYAQMWEAQAQYYRYRFLNPSPHPSPPSPPPGICSSTSTSGS